MCTSKLTLLVLSAAMLTAACAGREPLVEPTPAPADAPALDIVGMYDFTASLGGQTRTGTLLIDRTPAGYAGEGRLAGESEPATIDSVAVDGNKAIILANVSGQPISFELHFTGGAFAGFIFADSEAIEVTGSRRAP